MEFGPVGVCSILVGLPGAAEVVVVMNLES
jgi:hypothetical protein